MSTKTCGAKTRAGTPCRHPAGWGTDHVGEGRCKLHGGSSLRGVQHPNFVDGRHSKHFDPSDVIGFDEWRASLGEELEFTDQVLFRVFIASQLTVDEQGRLQPKQVMTRSGPMELPADAKYLLECADLAGRVFERLRQAREGQTVIVRFADDQVARLLDAVGRAIGEHVRDPQEREAVLTDIEAAVATCQAAGMHAAGEIAGGEEDA